MWGFCSAARPPAGFNPRFAPTVTDARLPPDAAGGRLPGHCPRFKALTRPGWPRRVGPFGLCGPLHTRCTGGDGASAGGGFRPWTLTSMVLLG